VEVEVGDGARPVSVDGGHVHPGRGRAKELRMPSEGDQILVTRRMSSISEIMVSPAVGTK
jgi:hypothetical protein